MSNRHPQKGVNCRAQKNAQRRGKKEYKKQKHNKAKLLKHRLSFNFNRKDGKQDLGSVKRWDRDQIKKSQKNVNNNHDNQEFIKYRPD